MSIKNLINCDYLSYGVDSNEEDEQYFYLQASNRLTEDFEIVPSHKEFLPKYLGLFLSFVFGKKLVRW